VLLPCVCKRIGLVLSPARLALAAHVWMIVQRAHVWMIVQRF